MKTFLGYFLAIATLLVCSCSLENDAPDTDTDTDTDSATVGDTDTDADSDSDSDSDPLAETVHSIVILIDFDDAPGDVAVEWVDDFFNTPGWTDGENLINVKDYWWEVSRHRFNLVSHIFGYYRASQSASYYQNESWEVSVELFGQAFDWVVAHHPDFDWDQISLRDGLIRGVTCVPSTNIAGSGGTHWIGDRIVDPNGHHGGSLAANTLSLFGILHEQGHMLFEWPDLYNIHGSSGTGRYDIMSSNTYWIGVPNAFYTIEEGWVNPIDVTGSTTVVLDENGAQAVRYINTNNPEELFVIEARNNAHKTTARIPSADRGLYIWHVDGSDVGWNGNYDVDLSAGEHYYISLEQADGRYDLEHGANAADEGDAYGTGDIFSENAVPDSNWWNGSSSGFQVDQIQLLQNDQISFRVTVD